MTSSPLIERLETKRQVGWRSGPKGSSPINELRNPDGPEAAALIRELVEALEPFTRGPDNTSLAKLYAHLNRVHYLNAKAALSRAKATSND